MSARAPDVVTPPPGNPRFPLFDGLRAMAALMVLLTHTAGITGFNLGNSVLGPFTARLNVGVTVFFVISGFLLYRPFVSARMDGRPRPRVRTYARRRALRIVPAYYVALTALAIWPGLVGVFTHQWWVYYGFLQNTRTIWDIGGISPAWSLCVEVGFYAVLPLYAYAMHRWLDGRALGTQLRTELWALAGLGLLALAVRTLIRETNPFSTYSNTLPGSFLWFTLGMGLAVASAAYDGRAPIVKSRAVAWIEQRPWVAWVVALGILTFTTRLGLQRAYPFPYTNWQWFEEHVLFAAFAFFLVLPAVFGRSGVVAAVLGWRPLAWLGLVSYGIFLWHIRLLGQLISWHVQTWWPHTAMLTITVITFLWATAMATLSYYLVERPILRFKDPPATRRARGENQYRGLSRWTRASARRAAAVSPRR